MLVCSSIKERTIVDSFTFIILEAGFGRKSMIISLLVLDGVGIP